jgi:hypothetical protein
MHKLKKRLETQHRGKLAEMALQQEEAQVAHEKMLALEKLKSAEQHEQKLKHLHET